MDARLSNAPVSVACASRVRRLAVLAAAVLAACRPLAGPPPAEPSRPAGVADATAIAYVVEPARSEVRLLVYRDGPLARLGHNHVISSSGLTGEVYLAPAGGRSAFLLALPVATLEVDRPELREAEGEDFPPGIDADAIAGTRGNLLGEQVLDAARYPEITVRSLSITGGPEAYEAHFEVGLRDTKTALTAPVSLTRLPDGIQAAGEFRVRQTSLGLAPFSVFMGALSVRDEVVVKFRVFARPRA